MNKSSNYSKYINEIYDMLRKPVVSVLPGHLSFFLLLSIIPIIMIFVVIASTFSLSYDGLIDFITLSLPASTSKVILPLLNDRVPDISLVFLIISTLFLASRGTKAIIITSNNIYNVNRNWVQELIKSIVLTILLIILLLFIVIILVLGGKILEILQSSENFKLVSNNILNIISLLRWPFSIMIIFFTIKLIYILTPNKKISSKSVNKGSLFTTISWILLTILYSFYVMNYATYNTYYGSASNLLVLMLWIYLISQLFVIGMIINSIEYKREKKGDN